MPAGSVVWQMLFCVDLNALSRFGSDQIGENSTTNTNTNTNTNSNTIAGSSDTLEDSLDVTADDDVPNDEAMTKLLLEKFAFDHERHEINSVDHEGWFCAPLFDNRTSISKQTTHATGHTLLFRACMNDDVTVVRWAIERGADVDVRDSRGY